MNQKVLAAGKGTYEKLLAFLNSKLGFLCIGMGIMAGIRFWKLVLPAIMLFFGVPSVPGSPLSQMTAPPPMATPMACAMAMKDMHDALVELRTTVQGQDRRIQELTNSVTEGFKSANQRIDNMLLNGKHSQATGFHYNREAARARLNQVLDKGFESAAAQGDLVGMNAAEARIK